MVIGREIYAGKRESKTDSCPQEGCHTHTEEIETLDPDGRHYKRLKADLDDRLYRMYDKIDEQEQSLIEAKAFAADTYTVTFNSDGGSAVESQTLFPGEKAAGSAGCSPARRGR